MRIEQFRSDMSAMGSIFTSIADRLSRALPPPLRGEYFDAPLRERMARRIEAGEGEARYDRLGGDSLAVAAHMPIKRQRPLRRITKYHDNEGTCFISRFFFSLAAPVSAFIQTRPDFSGLWRLDPPAPPRASPRNPKGPWVQPKAV